MLSGLALGIDAIAHTAALDAGGVTIAIMPGSAGEVYPKSHQALARRILQSGGALLSEFCEHTNIFPSHFVRRSRIVAALADGVLVTEAAIQSGTIHTAGFALDYGRPVMAVPGHITHPMGGGANRLIATGARLITSAADVLEEIGSAHTRQQVPLPLAENAYEHAILTLIGQGVRDGESLQKQSQLEPALFSQTLTMLEITNKIRPLGGNQWSL